MKDKNTLEWAARWIEDSLKGETNDRVIEFGTNMAMTLRAASTTREVVGAENNLPYIKRLENAFLLIIQPTESAAAVSEERNHDDQR